MKYGVGFAAGVAASVLVFMYGVRVGAKVTISELQAAFDGGGDGRRKVVDMITGDDARW